MSCECVVAFPVKRDGRNVLSQIAGLGMSSWGFSAHRNSIQDKVLVTHSRRLHGAAGSLVRELTRSALQSSANSISAAVQVCFGPRVTTASGLTLLMGVSLCWCRFSWWGNQGTNRLLV